MYLENLSEPSDNNFLVCSLYHQWNIVFVSECHYLSYAFEQAGGYQLLEYLLDNVWDIIQSGSQFLNLRHLSSQKPNMIMNHEDQLEGCFPKKIQTVNTLNNGLSSFQRLITAHEIHPIILLR